MILKNKRTGEKLEITYQEFRKKFTKEIQVAYESFRQTELNKSYYKLNDDNSIESNFYFDLQWNFNDFSNSTWFIERM